MKALRIAAAVMFLGIALGAMGAHALESKLEETGRLDNWKTAALYQMIHGLAMFAVALRVTNRRTPLCFWCWLAGVVLFSGSLYLLSVTGVTKLGAVTPFGGLAFLIGWLALIFQPGFLGDRSSE